MILEDEGAEAHYWKAEMMFVQDFRWLQRLRGDRTTSAETVFSHKTHYPDEIPVHRCPIRELLK